MLSVWQNSLFPVRIHTEKRIKEDSLRRPAKQSVGLNCGFLKAGKDKYL